MPLLDLNKITAGLPTTWPGFLRDWDRSLRSGNYPEATRYSYLLAAAQLSRHLGSIHRIRTPMTRPRIRPMSLGRILRRSRQG